jgi:predicted RNase H-like HicB family nuclease
MTHTYTALLSRQADGGTFASVPALKGCHSEGDGLPEALLMIRDSMGGYLSVLEEDGDPIPGDVDYSASPGEHAVAVRM